MSELLKKHQFSSRIYQKDELDRFFSGFTEQQIKAELTNLVDWIPEGATGITASISNAQHQSGYDLLNNARQIIHTLWNCLAPSEQRSTFRASFPPTSFRMALDMVGQRNFTVEEASGYRPDTVNHMVERSIKAKLAKLRKLDNETWVRALRYEKRMKAAKSQKELVDLCNEISTFEYRHLK